MKRLALISDIHGNAVALDAVLADIRRRRIDEIVCLGDVAAGGPQPGEALARLRHLGCAVVRGNADDWLLGEAPNGEDDDARRLRELVEWAREQMVDADIAYLESFPPTVEIDLGESGSILCVHGSPLANSDRLLPTTPEEELGRLFADTTADLLAGGHTHVQLMRPFGGRLLVNPGSVGLPLHPDAKRLAPFAEYAVIEADAVVSIELRKVPVEVAKLERAGRDSGMPDPDWWAAGLARRIAQRNALAIA